MEDCNQIKFVQRFPQNNGSSFFLANTEMIPVADSLQIEQFPKQFIIYGALVVLFAGFFLAKMLFEMREKEQERVKEEEMTRQYEESQR